MRAYFFGNMYLSSIQQGIQAQHCTAELFCKYSTMSTGDSIQNSMLYDWAKDHKTTILLNGGGTQDLYDIQGLLSLHYNPYPWAYFHEDEIALQSALTCIGLILPARIYEAAEELRENDCVLGVDLLDWDLDLCKILNSCGLAR